MNRDQILNGRTQQALHSLFLHVEGLQTKQIKNGSMGKGNKTSVSEFVLLGFSDHPHLQLLISVTIFLVFLMSVLGNFMFLMLVCADPHLQKPMYFFLGAMKLTISSAN
uniref:Olfactory receptor 2G3-like isoform X2 n=1 Tax=Geotrypetes seraphini TaxID=260995 RepID=A0A6P8R9V3_GEOSA|nr:olfactory receptor 2G3-like isoform X2 [Geotrypetes seraphini]